MIATQRARVALVCPACRASIAAEFCGACGRSYPLVAGVRDYRLASDRYLSLDAERLKAERLAAIAETTDLEGVARAYYAITPDVDPPRCAGYLAHILAAEPRAEAIVDEIEIDGGGGPILEVGCGSGALLAAGLKRGLEIEGVDIAARWLVVARRRLQDAGFFSARLTAADAARLPWADASFATVVADSVLEHCDDPLAALREWRRVLRPGGRLVVWSPNRFSLGADPHVRLRGVGYLPRPLGDAYSRLRRGGAWVPRTQSAGSAARMVRLAGFGRVEVGPPAIPDRWLAAQSRSKQTMIRLYNLMIEREPGRTIAVVVGPLWAIRAVAAPSEAGERASNRGLAACLAAEIVAGGVGFLATIHLARRLGPERLAALEIAAAWAGWMLVLVRSGLDQVVIREAARHPRLIGRLTGILLALRCVWAVVGIAGIGVVALAMGGDRAGVTLAAAAVLVPSALVADVGPRARNELGFLAWISIARALGLIGGALVFVAGPGDLLAAAALPAAAETAAAICCAWRSIRRGGWPRPCWSARAAAVLSSRAAVAGLTRFVRVGLYAADGLALGLLAARGGGVGAYAAGRRVTFALIAAGLVVPALLAPGVARARARGTIAAEAEVARGVALLLAWSIPAALGAMLVAHQAMPMLFGPEYRQGGATLAAIVARLPPLLTATWLVSALVALGREARAMRLMLGVAAGAVVIVPLAALAGGPHAIAGAMIGVEASAAAAGWVALRRLGIHPGRAVEARRILVGSLGLAGGVAVAGALGSPLWAACLAGALGYAIGWSATARRRR
jgi:O-antigen/teichoic acid export membrane protein/SAM-dependent methyltransferase